MDWVGLHCFSLQDLHQVMVSGPNLNETSIVSGGYGGTTEGIIPTSAIKGQSSGGPARCPPALALSGAPLAAAGTPAGRMSLRPRRGELPACLSVGRGRWTMQHHLPTVHRLLASPDSPVTSNLHVFLSVCVMAHHPLPPLAYVSLDSLHGSPPCRPRLPSPWVPAFQAVSFHLTLPEDHHHSSPLVHRLPAG